MATIETRLVEIVAGGAETLSRLLSGRAPEIYATGTCFDDVLDTLERMIVAGKGELAVSLTVVHAIVLAPEGTVEAGKRYAHAWLETPEGEAWLDGFVGHRQCRVTLAVDAAEYRQSLRIQKEVRYTVREVRDLNGATCHYGPWDAEIAALAVPRGEGRPFKRLCRMECGLAAADGDVYCAGCREGKERSQSNLDVRRD